MEKKEECDIVQDLLINYVDDILNSTSKKFVETHLKTCEKCQEKLNNIKADIEEKTEENEEKEIDYLRNVKKKISRKNKLLWTSGIILIIIIILNIGIFIHYNISDYEMTIFLNDDITTEEKENIEKVLKGENGKIEIHYNTKEEELEKLKSKFKENQDLLSGFQGENNPYPANYKITAKKEEIEKLEKILISMEGIKKVHSNTNLNPYEFLISNIY